jgi:hypothetical protein
MKIQQRINAFAQLGQRMRSLANAAEGSEEMAVLRQAGAVNGWFTPENLRYALKGWSNQLVTHKLVEWLKHYPVGTITAPKTVGIVMAGNIPLVGFHDLISVLMAGHRVIARLSSKDNILLPYLIDQLVTIEPEFKAYIGITEEQLVGFDAVIATGSNNTSRYFDHYFGRYPNLIRKNRNSVAILSGEESQEELLGLADDIFRYYGLGCRNVSKLLLPGGYDFKPLFEALYSWKGLVDHSKYINNYDYNKAVYLMSNIQLLDNEFVLLKEDEGLSSPIGVLFYQYYHNNSQLEELLELQRDGIQVIVASYRPNSIPFGTAQRPGLSDYADGADSMTFLHDL